MRNLNKDKAMVEDFMLMMGESSYAETIALHAIERAIAAESKVEKMQKALDEWNNAALIPCNTCDGSGFNGYGTGYDAVCDGCAGNGGYTGRATPQDLIEMIEKRMSKGNQ